MRQFFLYWHYAVQNLRRSGRWTAFAVFCVAAGVATMVALRTLGLSITDSLLTNVREFNHGDINVSVVSSTGPFSFTFQRGADEQQIYSQQQIERVQAWADQRGAQITAYAFAGNVQLTTMNDSQASRPQFISTFFIDPQTFEIAGDIVALDPAGVRVRDLLTGGPEVVVSENLAESLGIQVGDQVRVSGTETLFTVRGIVPTESEASINNLLASFFGFAYFDAQLAPLMQLTARPNTIGIVLHDGATADDIEAAAQELTSLRIPIANIHTTPQLLLRNQELADIVGRFIVMMGLGAMLIGGVGIMNTMLVMVGRRTMEIASLKTFGLKGYQVAALFVTEAFLMGLMGSIVGIIAGLIMSRGVNQYGEAFLQQHIPWRLHPEAVVYGLALGLVVTVVFGVLPVLTATKVRPNIILRPNEAHIPRAGWTQSLVALGLVVLVLGIIAGQILSPLLKEFIGIQTIFAFLLGIIGVAGALIVLAVMTAVFWGLVWAIGRLPSFGSAGLRLAMANLSMRRFRTATTLLALTAGMFALSSISFVGLGTRDIVRFQFSETLGGNIIAVPLLPEDFGQPLIEALLRLQPGVERVSWLSFNNARIRMVDGVRPQLDDRPFSPRLTVLTRNSDTQLASGPVLAGRDLEPEDRGQPVIVLSQQAAVESLLEDYTLDDLGITVGSKIGLAIHGSFLEFEVVGIVGNANGLAPNIAGAYLPPDIPGVIPDREVSVALVEPDKVNDVLLSLSTTPLVFAIDATFIDSLLKRLIDQLSAIPIVVGLLSLLAAAVIMANTVSLATLERRNQIGILKAVGLKRRRVLGIMLLENTVIGLLGGGLGVGISMVATGFLTAFGTGVVAPLPPGATSIAVGLVVASVLIAWLATFLSARVAIGEKVTAVLRYE
ncbi:MAG: ABC transporter permease [Anaerolineaceae bacterium]|nr:ABC transporter permease [Anaerolineaceae bacterium]